MGLSVPNFDSSLELRFDLRHTGGCKQPCLGNPTVKLCHSVQTGDLLSSRSNRVSRVGRICPLLQSLRPRALFFACAAKERQRSGCPPAPHRFLSRGFPSPRARQSLLSRDSSCSPRLSGSVRARYWGRIFCRTGTATLAISACSGRRSLPIW